MADVQWQSSEITGECIIKNLSKTQSILFSFPEPNELDNYKLLPGKEITISSDDAKFLTVQTL